MFQLTADALPTRSRKALPLRRQTPPALRVLSWGGGRDSTTLLLMSYHGELPLLDAAIWANTHREPPHVYQTFAEVTQLVRARIPAYEVSTGDLGADVLAASRLERPPGSTEAWTVSQPPFYVKNAPNKVYATAVSGGMLKRKCTGDYKIVPIRQKIRQLLGAKPVGRLQAGVWVEQWIGFPSDEQTRTFCSDVQWITNTFPLILPSRMTKRDCASWLTGHGYPVYAKSSCYFCPYHDNAAWRAMRDTDPDSFQAAIAFETALHAGKLPAVRGIPYLHPSMIPLAMAPIDVPDDGPSLNCFACNT